MLTPPADDERADVVYRDVSWSQGRRVTIISEPGLYELVFRSQMPNAKDFSRWLAHEVLPALRTMP